VNKPVLVPPLFWIFSADLLPEVMLVNHWTWRNKLLKHNTNLTVTKSSTNILLMSKLTCVTFSEYGKTTVWLRVYENKQKFCFLNF
jgi:hypothetical protein